MEKYYIVRQPNPGQEGEAFLTLQEACDAAARKVNSNFQHATAVVFETVCLVKKRVPLVDIEYFKNPFAQCYT